MILLDKLQVLGRISATGVKILVPALREANYSPFYWRSVKEIDRKGLIIIKEQDMPSAFILKHESMNRSAGRSLLMLIHFCLVEHSILIINEEDTFIKNICETFKVQVYSLGEFNIATINNKEYFDFMEDIKKERILK
nr:hypothetical protein [uncultured Pedobacter sp.]